jgi:hypothetical protein
MRIAKFRQLAMIHAMQGLLVHFGPNKLTPETLAKYAVQHADALLEANTVEETHPDANPS